MNLSPISLALVLLLVVHELGLRREPPGDGGRSAKQRFEQAWLVRLGVIVAVGALDSPLAALAHRELFGAALIDLVLAFAVAPVVVLGAPWRPLRLALPASSGPAGSTAPRAPGRHTAVPGQPVTGLVALVAAFWAWHLPGALDATVASQALRQLEYASYLIGGLLFWSELLPSHPYVPRLGMLQRAGLIVGAFVGYWGLSAMMVYGPTSWYPAFAHAGGQIIPATVSQELAGAIMWALPSIPLGVATFWCFAGWLDHESDDERHLLQLYEQGRRGQAGQAPALGGPGKE